MEGIFLDRKREALYAQFSRLDPDNHGITSPPSDEYNCVAWVKRDLRHWWEPGFHWPPDLEPAGDQDLEEYIELFRRWGFEICGDGSFENGYLKIAIYAEGGRFHHVAKQVPWETWSSKAGPLHDLWHMSLDLLEGVGVWRFARPSVFMRRAYDGTDPFELEQGRVLRN
jgi:hypothetical protein